MAAFAIGHLLPFAGPQTDSRHRMSPDIAAVSADAILLEYPQLVGLAVRSVAPLAGQLARFHVLDVREAHVIRLPRIHAPRHFAIGCDIVVDKELLRYRRPHRLGMAAR